MALFSCQCCVRWYGFGGSATGCLCFPTMVGYLHMLATLLWMLLSWVSFGLRGTSLLVRVSLDMAMSAMLSTCLFMHRQGVTQRHNAVNTRNDSDCRADESFFAIFLSVFLSPFFRKWRWRTCHSWSPDSYHRQSSSLAWRYSIAPCIALSWICVLIFQRLRIYCIVSPFKNNCLAILHSSSIGQLTPLNLVLLDLPWKMLGSQNPSSSTQVMPFLGRPKVVCNFWMDCKPATWCTYMHFQS